MAQPELAVTRCVAKAVAESARYKFGYKWTIDHFSRCFDNQVDHVDSPLIAAEFDRGSIWGFRLYAPRVNLEEPG